MYVTHDQTEAMTLGDRVVVMRGGLVQQVGAPQELYDHPQNLFVAGFIGSPSMNFVPGQIENGSIRTSFGEFRLPDERWETVRRNNPSREVVVGIRPEHFEDADLLDPTQRETGVTFSAEVDVLESMGSDKFAYFTAEGPGVHSKDLDELAADAGADMSAESLVARLSVESQATKGGTVQLWFDPAKIALFDQETGANVTL